MSFDSCALPLALATLWHRMAISMYVGFRQYSRPQSASAWGGRGGWGSMLAHETTPAGR